MQCFAISSMKIFGALFVALLVRTSQGIGGEPTRHNAFLKTWTTLSEQSSLNLVDSEPMMMSQAFAGGRRMNAGDLSDTKADAFATYSENKKKKRQDPYQPESTGAATVND